MAAALFANPDGIANLTADERVVWDSYQRFLNCIDLEIANRTPGGAAMTAATLALATVYRTPVP